MKEIKKMEREARKCYAEPIGLENNEFVEMMKLDACFVIEFVRKCYERGSEVNDLIFNIDWMENQICRDLILLENELPYFVLSKLNDMTEDPAVSSEPFMIKAMNDFSRMLPKLCPISKSLIKTRNSHEIKHLLQVLHILCRPPFEKSTPEGTSSNTISSGNKILKQMHNVTQLHKAGIEFKKVKVCTGAGGNNAYDSTSLFDIKFSNGLPVTPSFRVEDSTGTFFRNLIAYEQQTSDVDLKYITDYTYFMDKLINTTEDVGLLRLSGIIVNMLGDDKEVDQLFNRLGNGVGYSSINSYYSGVCRGLNQHCNKLWNTVMARLRHDYFYSLWAVASTVAAVMLLLLTITQTIAAVLSLSNGWKK